MIQHMERKLEAIERVTNKSATTARDNLTTQLDAEKERAKDEAAKKAKENARQRNKWQRRKSAQIETQEKQRLKDEGEGEGERDQSGRQGVGRRVESREEWRELSEQPAGRGGDGKAEEGRVAGSGAQEEQVRQPLQQRAARGERGRHRAGGRDEGVPVGRGGNAGTGGNGAERRPSDDRATTEPTTAPATAPTTAPTTEPTIAPETDKGKGNGNRKGKAKGTWKGKAEAEAEAKAEAEADAPADAPAEPAASLSPVRSAAAAVVPGAAPTRSTRWRAPLPEPEAELALAAADIPAEWREEDPPCIRARRRDARRGAQPPQIETLERAVARATREARLEAELRDVTTRLQSMEYDALCSLCRDLRKSHALGCGHVLQTVRAGARWPSTIPRARCPVHCKRRGHATGWRLHRVSAGMLRRRLLSALSALSARRRRSRVAPLRFLEDVPRGFQRFGRDDGGDGDGIGAGGGVARIDRVRTDPQLRGVRRARGPQHRGAPVDRLGVPEAVPGTGARCGVRAR